MGLGRPEALSIDLGLRADESQFVSNRDKGPVFSPFLLQSGHESGPLELCNDCDFIAQSSVTAGGPCCTKAASNL
jgi:hypothetical protein